MKQEGRAVEFVMPRKDSIVDVIAYCIMPNHIHLLLNQTQESGLSVFMSNMLNSYTRYFNVKHDRKGPLWESRPKKTLIDSDEQLLHVTRYIHLNPVTAYMADRPQDWVPSSYSEYVSCIKDQDRICKFRGLISMDRQAYRAFVEEGVKYQREMARCRNNLAGGTSQVVCGGVK
jgi:putative transposase